MDILAARRRSLESPEPSSCDAETIRVEPSKTTSKEVVACVPEHWGMTPALPKPSAAPSAPLSAEEASTWPDAALDQQAGALRRRVGSEASYWGRAPDLESLEVVEYELRTRAASATDYVEMCGRPADIPVIGGVSEHRWLRTRTKAAGMGAADDDRLPGRDGQSSMPGDATKLTNHTNDTPVHCEVQPQEDEECVNRELELGKDTGRWWPWNQCHTVVDDILERCEKK